MTILLAFVDALKDSVLALNLKVSHKLSCQVAKLTTRRLYTLYGPHASPPNVLIALL
jgi:hypothetical protein